MRNLVRKETRKRTKQIQSDIAKSCKENPKKFWHYVNSKNKTSRSIGNITVTDSLGNFKIIENEMDKAEAFSDHFRKIFINEPDFDLADEIPQVSNPGMEMITFCEADIRKKLSKLKVSKSPGPDALHSRMLFELENVIPTFLKAVFDHSYEGGVIPED